MNFHSAAVCVGLALAAGSIHSAIAQSDPNSGSPSGTNQPPVAVDDSYQTAFGRELTVLAADGVLHNDFDPDGDPIEVVSHAQSTMGFVTMFDDGRFTFTPDSGASGTETLTYTISDGSEQASADFTLTIEANNPPVAVNDRYSTPIGQVLSINASQGLLANDFDLEGADIEVLHFNQGVLGFFSIFPDGSFTYTPDAGASGRDTVSYTIGDGHDTGTGKLTIEIGRLFSDGFEVP